MVNSERLSPLNLGDGVNLSTSVENSAANQVRRVLCPVSFRFAQGPRQRLKTLCICTGEQSVHPVHQFTKLGTLSLTHSRGFPTPCPSEPLRGPGSFIRTPKGVCLAGGERMFVADGATGDGVWGRRLKTGVTGVACVTASIN